MIKFRVWDKLTQKYWNIENWHFEDEYLDLIEPGVSICDPRIERIWRKQGDVEIMQYTGLKDANGKDIYEGDIVRILSINVISDIKYMRDGFTPEFEIDRQKVFDDDNVLGAAAFESDIEVISNVHENPELLEE